MEGCGYWKSEDGEAATARRRGGGDRTGVFRLRLLCKDQIAPSRANAIHSPPPDLLIASWYFKRIVAAHNPCNARTPRLMTLPIIPAIVMPPSTSQIFSP